MGRPVLSFYRWAAALGALCVAGIALFSAVYAPSFDWVTSICVFLVFVLATFVFVTVGRDNG